MSKNNPPKAAPVRWYDIKAAATPAAGQGTSATIYIYGDIGDSWDENGVIAADLVKELAGLDVDEIELRINSFGGSVPDGMAIYNALKRHRATVNGFVDGVAISCAGYIAMACDTLTMAKNAQLMIHAPWGYSYGNAQELRIQADLLDKWAQAMTSAYADKSGKPYEECLALLTDGQDHWYLADEALAEGWADAVGDANTAQASLARSFDLNRFTPANASLRPVAAATSYPKEPMPTPTTAAAPNAASQAAPAAPYARTKDDNQQVLAMFAKHQAKTGVMALQTEVLADPSLTMPQIQAKLLEKLGEGVTPANPQGSYPSISTVEDEADKRRGAVVNALLVRAGVNVNKEVRASLGANPYRGHTLLDIARASLQRIGVSTDGMDKMAVVAAAFTQSTSDFPVLLENTMHKTLQAAYAVAPLTWTQFCAVGTVSDFRAHNRYRAGSFGNLDSLNELGEFKNKSIPDGEKASITAGTKGNIINLSRQMIVNDDLGAFVGLASNLGRAAARTVEADVYTMLALNGGLGPLLSDGKTLFHADHKNLTAGAAITMDAIEADRVAMASQKDVGGNDYLSLRPSAILLPIGLGSKARTLNTSQYDPDALNKLQKPNVVAGLFQNVVDSPRIEGTRRYLFADPMEAPVLEVAFLDGQQEPYLEQEVGFTVDGSRFKVRLDYGMAAIDYRGAVTNAGA